MGEIGQQGPQGDPGPPGADGKDGLLAYDNAAFIIVQTTDDPITNGNNLRDAITAANDKSPAVGKRVVVVVPPGQYNLEGTAIVLSKEYVDLVGLTTGRDSQSIYGTDIVLRQSANNVRIENLSLYSSHTDSNTPTYKPESNLDKTIIKNCRINQAAGYPTGKGTTYSGTYINVDSDGCLFGLMAQASGTFTNCSGGDGAFGGDSASGTFTNCTGGNNAFGGLWASGIFTNCTGGDYAFGLDSSGIFTYCSGGDSAFGGNNSARGTFKNCTGGDYAFGGGSAASGTFTNCTGGNNAFGGNVLGGDGASGTFTNCIGGDKAFGWDGKISGTFTNCTGGDGAFAGLATSTGHFYYCYGGADSFPSSGAAYDALFCIKAGNPFP
jgi:hypothetical protein